MRINKFLFLLIITCLFVLNFSVYAQEDADTQTSDAQDVEDTQPSAAFGLGLLLGVETFDPTSEGGEPETYQTLALSPDLAIGKFGIGLDIALHYRFDENGFNVRAADWVPEEASFLSVMDLYLPKITYVRWGFKGDSLYVKLGQIEDSSLGTGFIVNNYSNTLFQPDEKIAGLNFDFDLQMFDFPYIGIETFIGNLARFDVFGGRLYSRPLLWSGVPVIKNLEWGITCVTDLQPDLRPEFFTPYNTDVTDAVPVLIYGTDLILPILNFEMASLALFGDIAFEDKNMGGMVGLGGRLFNIIPYIIQLRILGDNFIPAYFDNSYDIYRGMKYALVKYSGTEPLIPSSISWLANTGVSILDDQLVFQATVDGPFALPPTDSKDAHSYLEYPHLGMELQVSEGLIPDFSFSAYYDKKYITEFVDLFLAEDSMIGLEINYNAGAAVITMAYNMLYLDDGVVGTTWDDFDVSSSLSCSIALF